MRPLIEKDIAKTEKTLKTLQSEVVEVHDEYDVSCNGYG